jgi:hypothetical protein
VVVVGGYLLWEGICCGRVFAVGEYLLWEGSRCGRVAVE